MATPQVLSVAVCLYNDVTVLDYQGALDILGGVGFCCEKGFLPRSPKFVYDFKYLAKSLEPVQPIGSAPKVVPTMTYSEALDPEAKQFDIIIVPAGSMSGEIEQEAVMFLAKQSPGAKYVLTVCGGSAILAATGFLNGKRATTNKAGFKMIQAAFDKVNWVPKARWVVDGNIWTASGITAGFDMAHAFLSTIEGQDIATSIVNVLEYRPRLDPEDDEFAIIHGLVPLES
ncbi:hypothetical protein JAAARDRAFT_173908 [Jaapia argillacea MUCL 33604]|uniref:DJ-1/PfpI domain-containing protein n=1 Tax=Jaapia argillacea MUCL 33604 TaxID=933084 RepID=A0A067QF99_9AGAM|nr:hypothetical protein JAAARDRAFT_173908 [Jaapia argillacea MUCL 33604]